MNFISQQHQLPIKIGPAQMAELQNKYLHTGDITGLYLVIYSETAVKLQYYLQGVLWSFNYLGSSQRNPVYTTKSSSNRVDGEEFLDFVNRTTPEFIPLLLWILPNPSILLSKDFKTRSL